MNNLRLLCILLAFGSILVFLGCSQTKDGVSPDAAKCGVCHMVPPATAAHQGAGIRDCGTCHAGYDSVTTVSATHNNGVVDVAGGCASCHEYPPIVSLHPTHLQTLNYNCGVCHPGGADTAGPTTSGIYHRNDVVNVAISYPFTITPAQTNTATWTEATRTCASVYCHGKFTGGNGSGTVKADTTVTCGGCHALPYVASGTIHQRHSATIRSNCANCHTGYSGTTGATYKVNTANHVNGSVEWTDVNQSNAACSSCH